MLNEYAPCPLEYEKSGSELKSQPGSEFVLMHLTVPTWRVEVMRPKELYMVVGWHRFTAYQIQNNESPKMHMADVKNWEASAPG